ncbi:MAG TPA: DciA family protein [Stellaceae bacterium]|nr:DciA family protein [Stellaceae bacterium]
MGRKSVDDRHGFMQAIGANLTRIATPVLGKQGLGEAQLLQQWPAIVGDDLARYCWPVKLSFPRGQRRNGTLRLRVASALALEIQHREPVLLERINGYFGYRAVIRLALIQGGVPAETPPPSPRPLAPAERQALGNRLDGIADPALRAALERLGSAIIGRQ